MRGGREHASHQLYSCATNNEAPVADFSFEERFGLSFLIACCSHDKNTNTVSFRRIWPRRGRHLATSNTQKVTVYKVEYIVAAYWADFVVHLQRQKVFKEHVSIVRFVFMYQTSNNFIAVQSRLYPHTIVAIKLLSPTFDFNESHRNNISTGYRYRKRHKNGV